MAGGVCLRAGAALAAVMLGVLAWPAAATAQSAATSTATSAATTFKVAYYNIKAGKGHVGLTGTATFADTTNCTDASKALNAWGVGLVQQHLLASIGNDPSVLALGLGESWASVCGSPENVRQALGWQSRSSERNGVAMVARHGFAGPEEWIQLDTSLNNNPADTMWVLRRDVCMDATCSQSVPVFVAHWYGTGTYARTTYERQAQQTADFLTQRGGAAPHVLVGDLNVWEGTAKVCNQNPNNTALAPLRAAGYVDAWPLLHGSAEGFTGMLNRNGCGNPMGYAWKRIDYAWSPPSFQPLSVARFGMVTAGIEAPSDHYGIIAEYAVPGAEAPSDTTAPIVNILSPVGGTVLTTGTVIDIAVDATDDLGVSRVELLQDGAVTHTLTSAPYQVACGMVTATAGTRTLVARAFDAAGNMATSAPVSVTVDDPYAPAQEPPPASEPAPVPAAAPGEIVLFAHDATTVAGNWQMVGDSTAAGGVRIWNADAGLAKLNTAFAQPADYFELTFDAEAGVAYRVSLRGRADRNHWSNDSVFFQFSGSVNDSGAPVYRIGTTSATWLSVERCSGCQLRNWGWNDNGYGKPGPLVYFATSGPQTLRVQRREDGISIDQIVLSPAQYLVDAPGADVDDTTILVAASPVPPPATEILVTASALKTVAGGWRLLADASAAGGQAFGHPDAGAAKLGSALAAPAHYVELTFHAEAGLAYRLWIRGRADKDHWANDSVFVQFDGSLATDGAPAARIGTTASYTINLEEDTHWGVSGWGWQDNGYGAGVLGPLVTFENTGLQTIRIQTREDGLRIDQVVLSSATYLTVAPGALKNDTTILK